MPNIILDKNDTLDMSAEDRLKMARNRFFWMNPKLDIFDAMVGTVLFEAHWHETELAAATISFLDDGDITLFRLATDGIYPYHLTRQRMLDDYDWGLVCDSATETMRNMTTHTIDLPIRKLADEYDLELDEEQLASLEQHEHIDMQLEFFSDSQDCVSGFVYYDTDLEQLLFESKEDKHKALVSLYESFGVEFEG